MEARTLELIQHPENISVEDIVLLQKELSRFPFMQSLRTLQLSAVHHFDAENYQKELTKTAAYTTDKKILYQFINKKEIEQKEAEKLKKLSLVKQEAIQEKPIEEMLFQQVENQVVQSQDQEIPTFKIDETLSEAPFKTRQEDLNYTKETILEQLDKISDKEEDVLAVKPSEISFNGFESFLPDVKFTVPTAKSEALSVPATIELPKEEPKEELSFEAVQPFEVKKTEILEEKKIEPVKEEATEPIKVEAKPVEEKVLEMTPEPEVHFEWKPMNFTLNPLDSQIQKQEVEKPKPIEIKVEVNLIEEAKVEESKSEIKIESVVEEGVKAEEKEVETISENLLTQQLDAVESNVPDFVNTWQSWLKIDREVKPKEEAVQVEKTIEKKSEIIDRFIEDNPRISQLKEESQYVVKEKKADISHLMTETLAKLYVEQKLYSKAIKAYEVLKKKHPEKSEYFNIKIQEIKELKQNK